MEHLYEKLTAYSKTDAYPYHMPGHKRRLCGNIPSVITDMDITEIDGFDNLHQPEEIIKELQEKTAALYSADRSYFLVNGSTCGILSAISAAVPQGGHLLMARNCHKSAYHAVYLRGLQVTYLYPPMFSDFSFFDGITPQQVEQALQRQPGIKAVFIVSPTYEGRIADVAAIAEIVHAKGIPLIVDEAHGAHLGLAEGFADNSNQAGADIVIHSVHKTLPALTQTAILHCNGNRINKEKLERYLHIYQTSSPSYLLMASIDNALQIVEKSGKELFLQFRDNYKQMLDRLSACINLRFVTEVSHKQDIGKLVIDCSATEMSGKQLYDILRERYHLQLEMACESYCLAMFTIGDDIQAYERMTKALLEIDGEIHPSGVCLQAAKNKEKNDLECNLCEQAGTKGISLPLCRAWDMSWEEISLQQAVGRVVAEFVNLYPPGVPLLVPGEQFTEEMYRKLVSFLQQGLNVQGICRKDDQYALKCVLL